MLLLLAIAASIQTAPERPQLSDASGAAMAALEDCVVARSLHLEPSGEEIDRIIRVANRDCGAEAGRAEELILADLRAQFGSRGEARAEAMTLDILAIQHRLIDGDAESRVLAARADRLRPAAQ